MNIYKVKYEMESRNKKRNLYTQKETMPSADLLLFCIEWQLACPSNIVHSPQKMCWQLIAREIIYLKKRRKAIQWPNLEMKHMLYLPSDWKFSTDYIYEMH